MKKFILFMFFCFTLTAYSQTKQESIKELIHLVRNDSMVYKIIDSMMPSMMAQMQSQLKDSTAKARSEEIMKIVTESVKESTPKMMDNINLMYDKYFTEQDIKAFIEFYKSPTGQKSLTVMPEMMKDMMGNMMKDFIPDMKKNMQAKLEELKKKEMKN